MLIYMANSANDVGGRVLAMAPFQNTKCGVSVDNMFGELLRRAGRHIK